MYKKDSLEEEKEKGGSYERKRGKVETSPKASALSLGPCPDKDWPVTVLPSYRSYEAAL